MGDSVSDDAKENMRINLNKNRAPDDELMDAATTPPKIVIGRKPKPVKRLQHPESSRPPSSLLSHASSKTSGKNALLIQPSLKA